MMMRGMFGGHYLRAVRKTLFAETVSMNFVMTGMIPAMIILMHAWPDSREPVAPSFWFRMSLASVAGGMLAFPINWWLVRSHLKHGCMTLPGRDQPVPGLGHRSSEPSMVMPPAGHHDHGGHEGDAMQMSSLSTGRAAAWVVASFVILLAAIVATSRVVPIRFTTAAGWV